MEWFKEDWIQRAIDQRKKLIEEAKAQGAELVWGEQTRRHYPPLSGVQARAVLAGWFGILKQSTAAAKYVKIERFTIVIDLHRRAHAGALLAGSEGMPAEDVELLFQAVDETARALSEAAQVKNEIGDPPTLWEAFVYGLKNPGEIPGAVLEVTQDNAAKAWSFAKDKAKDAADELTPEIPWWVKAAAATGLALAALSTLASLRKPTR